MLQVALLCLGDLRRRAATGAADVYEVGGGSSARITPGTAQRRAALLRGRSASWPLDVAMVTHSRAKALLLCCNTMDPG